MIPASRSVADRVSKNSCSVIRSRRNDLLVKKVDVLLLLLLLVVQRLYHWMMQLMVLLHVQLSLLLVVLVFGVDGSFQDDLTTLDKMVFVATLSFFRAMV